MNDTTNATSSDKPKGAVPVKGILAGVVAIIVVMTLLQNSEKATVQFLGLSLSLPLWLLLLVAFALGVLFSGLVKGSLRRDKAKAAKK